MTEYRMATHSHVPWSEAWLQALASFSHPGRMRRGQQFADRRRVRRLEVKVGEITADVAGPGLKEKGRDVLGGRDILDRWYHVTIQLPPLGDGTWDKIVERLASQALYSARLLQGEMPPEVVRVFDALGAPLFPEAATLTASCTCPDWEVPCKHVVAVYYLLAERFDEDPFLLFLVRGRSQEQLLAMLRQQRQSTSVATANEREKARMSVRPVAPTNEETYQAPPLEQVLDTFWDAGPGIQQVVFHISPPLTPLPQIKRLGPQPFPNVNILELLAPIYETVTAKAMEWAYQMPGQEP